MKEIILQRDERLALRAQAHHLDPVVLMGSNGLTDAVVKEIDRELNAHELIKVRVPTDDREEREEIFAQVAEKLGAARVQMIGKLLIFWRPAQEEEAVDESIRSKAAKPRTGASKPAKKSVYAPTKRRRPKRSRTTKKAAMN